MALPEKRNNSIPRNNLVPRNSGSDLSSSIENIPLPRNELCEKIKKDIEKLKYDEKKPQCVKCVCNVTQEKDIHDWQMYIAGICSNYSRKLEGSIKFTVRILNDNTVGIWRIK